MLCELCSHVHLHGLSLQLSTKVEKFCKHIKKICCCCRREVPPHCCLLLLASSYYLSPSFMWHSEQFQVKLSRLACCYQKLFSRLIYLSVCHFIMMVLQHRTTLFVAITKRRLYAETQQQFRQHSDCKHFLTRNLFLLFSMLRVPKTIMVEILFAVSPVFDIRIVWNWAIIIQTVQTCMCACNLKEHIPVRKFFCDQITAGLICRLVPSGYLCHLLTPSGIN